MGLVYAFTTVATQAVVRPERAGEAAGVALTSLVRWPASVSRCPARCSRCSRARNVDGQRDRGHLPGGRRRSAACRHRRARLRERPKAMT